MISKKVFISFNYRLFMLPVFTRAFFNQESPLDELSYNMKKGIQYKPHALAVCRNYSALLGSNRSATLRVAGTTIATIVAALSSQSRTTLSFSLIVLPPFLSSAQRINSVVPRR